MDDGEVYQILRETFEEIFERSDISLKSETTAKDVEGWDSFKQVEILMLIEEKLGIKFTSKEMDSLSCVGDLADKIAAKMSHR